MIGLGRPHGGLEAHLRARPAGRGPGL